MFSPHSCLTVPGILSPAPRSQPRATASCPYSRGRGVSTRRAGQAGAGAPLPLLLMP